MRDYLRQKVLEHKDEVKNAISTAVTARQEETREHSLNSKRGVITGEGSVTGCYVLGNVQIAKGAHLSNSIIDDSVTLIIDEDVKITDCSFHGYLRPYKSDCVPTTIHIKKGCHIAHVWISMSTEIGEDSSILWACINANHQDYDTRDQPSPAIIGPNAIIYNGLIDASNSYKGDEEQRHAGCTIGKNLFMLSGRLYAEGGTITVGDDFVVCDYMEAWSLIRGKLSIEGGPYDTHMMDVLRNRIENFDGISVFASNMTIGNSGSVFARFWFTHAYEKLKDPSTYTFGDNVIMLTGSTAHHDSSTPSIFAHSFKVGNNVTICVTGSGWYANNTPYRTVDIGDNSLIRMQVRRDGQLLGPDIKAPREAIVII